jgi:hypothetical protein
MKTRFGVMVVLLACLVVSACGSASPGPRDELSTLEFRELTDFTNRSNIIGNQSASDVPRLTAVCNMLHGTPLLDAARADCAANDSELAAIYAAEDPPPQVESCGRAAPSRLARDRCALPIYENLAHRADQSASQNNRVNALLKARGFHGGCLAALSSPASLLSLDRRFASSLDTLVSVLRSGTVRQVQTVGATVEKELQALAGPLNTPDVKVCPHGQS